MDPAHTHWLLEIRIIAVKFTLSAWKTLMQNLDLLPKLQEIILVVQQEGDESDFDLGLSPRLVTYRAGEETTVESFKGMYALEMAYSQEVRNAWDRLGRDDATRPGVCSGTFRKVRSNNKAVKRGRFALYGTVLSSV
jgi:hypothetical protein